MSEDALFYPWGPTWTYAGTLTELHFASFDNFDMALALHPTLYRQYKSPAGRWLSPDPMAGDLANPQSLSRYASMR